MRFYARKSFAEMNKSCYEENGVGVQIADPGLIIQQQPLKKRMNRVPETPLKKVFKYNNLTISWIWQAFPRWCRPVAELLIVQIPHFDKLIDGFCSGFRFLPLLRHHLRSFLCVAHGHWIVVKELF